MTELVRLPRSLGAFAVLVAAAPASAQPTDKDASSYVQDVQAAPVPLARTSGPWLTLGAIAPWRAAVAGVRLQLDLIGGPRWTLGIAGTALESGTTWATSESVYVARGGALFGPLGLRAQLGLGLSQPATAMATTTPIVEAALLASVPLGSSWALVGGPIVQVAAGTSLDSSVMMMFGIQARR